jgi:hypothetical protein
VKNLLLGASKHAPVKLACKHTISASCCCPMQSGTRFTAMLGPNESSEDLLWQYRMLQHGAPSKALPNSLSSALMLSK